jgi:hypothetical protein
VAVLTLAGLAGAVYVGAVLLVAPSAASRAGAIAFAALAAYVLAGRTRGAWPLALAVVAVGLGLLLEEDVTEFGWFSYQPLSQPRPVSDDWSLALAPHDRLAIALLVAAVLLVVATAMAPRAGRRVIALGSLLILPAAGVAAVRIVRVAGHQPGGTGPTVIDLLLGAWTLVLATVALAVAAALGRGWPVTAGAVLVALVTLYLIDDALGRMPTASTGDAFLEPGLRYGGALPVGPVTDVTGAVAAAALFGGVLLAAFGLTRGSAPAVVPPEDAGDGVEA